MNNKYPEPKKDDYGLFYDSLPGEFRLATIDDFHVQGEIKAGMVFLVQWNDELRFSFQKAKPNLTGKKIKPFIDAEKVFVLNSQESF